MKFIKLIICLIVAMLVVGSLSTVTLANDFPVKNLKIICPFPAGGVADIVARSTAYYAERDLGKIITVVDMPGASGIAGTAAALNSKPDGYTLSYLSPALVVQKNYGKDVSYDWRTDVEVIVGLIRTPVILIVKKGSALDTLDKFVEEARKNPGSLNVAVTAQGGMPHLAGLQLEHNTDIDINLVPYQGISIAITALLGGHIDAMFGHPSLIKSYGDKIKVLGIAESERLDILPDIPTFKEQGYNVEIYACGSVGVPKGTPKEAVEKLRKAYIKAAQNPEFIEKMKSLGLVPECLTPEEVFERFEYMDKISKEYAPYINKK